MSEENATQQSRSLWFLGVGRSSRFNTRVWERRPTRGSVVGMFICLALLILIIAVVAVRFTGSNDKWDEWYAPGETRVGYHSSVFCSDVTLTNPSRTSSAAVYLLGGQPQLTVRYNFTIVDSLLLGSRSYKYWNFYMYPGSVYSFSSCLTYGTVRYYLIKGKNNFLNTHRSDGYELFQTTYSSACGVSNKTHSMSFTEEDEYYFVIFNPYAAEAKVKVQLSFNRTEYSPQSGGVIDFCRAAPASRCTLSVPYDANHVILVQAGTPGDGNWNTSVVLDSSCNPRVWVYALIVLIPTLGVVSVVALVVAVCCCLKRKATRYVVLPSVAMQDTAARLEDLETVATPCNPPPYTPVEVSPPPAYKPNPPAYTP